MQVWVQKGIFGSLFFFSTQSTPNLKFLKSKYIIHMDLKKKRKKGIKNFLTWWHWRRRDGLRAAWRRRRVCINTAGWGGIWVTTGYIIVDMKWFQLRLIICSYVGIIWRWRWWEPSIDKWARGWNKRAGHRACWYRAYHTANVAAEPRTRRSRRGLSKEALSVVVLK